MCTLLIVGTSKGRGDRLGGCPTTNNLLMNATSNQFMLQIPNISYTSASSCITYSLDSSFSSFFHCSRHSPLPHTRYDLRPSMILHHIFTLTVTVSLCYLSIAGEYSETKLKYCCKFNPTIFEPSSDEISTYLLVSHSTFVMSCYGPKEEFAMILWIYHTLRYFN